MKQERPVWWAIAAVLLVGAWFEAAAQFNIKFTYVCREGRYSVRNSKTGPWHYCFDGKYYSEKTIPADVKAWFDETARKHAEAMAEHDRHFAEAKERYAQSRAELNARRLARGEGVSWSRSRLGGTAAGGVVAASEKPEARPLEAEAVRAMAHGATAAEIVAALGEPPGKVATGEGSESWTYVLTTGEFAKIKLEAGRLKSVELP